MKVETVELANKLIKEIQDIESQIKSKERQLVILNYLEKDNYNASIKIVIKLDEEQQGELYTSLLKSNCHLSKDIDWQQKHTINIADETFFTDFESIQEYTCSFIKKLKKELKELNEQFNEL